MCNLEGSHLWPCLQLSGRVSVRTHTHAQNSRHQFCITKTNWGINNNILYTQLGRSFILLHSVHSSAWKSRAWKPKISVFLFVSFFTQPIRIWEVDFGLRMKRVSGVFNHKLHTCRLCAILSLNFIEWSWCAEIDTSETRVKCQRC